MIMAPSVPIAMFGWIPLVLLLFARFPARRAAFIGFLAGWMFLPVATYPIHGLPDYTKTLAVCGGVLLGVAIFDFRGLVSVRPALADIPILLFCVSPFFSAIACGLGLHEGLSVVFSQALTWGIPWTVGVIYFRSLAGLWELAVGIFIAGLIYVPLCIFEIVRGPKLHLWIYGFAQGGITRSAMRFGGWRPMVFMNSGLAVALWMAAASVLGIWIWKAGLLPSFHGIKIAWLAAVLVLTTLGLKSVNGWVLLLLGAILLLTAWRWRNSALVYVTILLVPTYIVVSATGVWSREQLLPPVSSILNAERAQSLRYRFLNERVIARNAREHPVLGWGRTAAAFEDRNHEIFRFGDPKTKAYAVIDSLWIGVFAWFGAIGLAGLLGTLLLPVALSVTRFPAARWREAKIAPVAALAVILLLYTYDDLVNGFINPVFMLIAGGLAHCGPDRATARRTAELR
jgi:hypothetical protein